MTRTDHERLSRLIDTPSTRNSAVAELLGIELDRARIVPDEKIPSYTVRMGSELQFTSDLDEDKLVQLVYPGEADISQNKISILTPIGTALIGLSTGQSIDWTARDGRVHRLTVESVEVPGANTPAQASAELWS